MRLIFHFFSQIGASALTDKNIDVPIDGIEKVLFQLLMFHLEMEYF